MSRNKVGICQWVLPIEGPYLCKFVSEIGLDGIQLFIGEYERGFPMSDDYVQKSFLEEGEKYKIEFPSIALRETDYYSMMAPNGSKEREVVLSAIKSSIDAAYLMKIPIVMIPQFAKSDIKNKEDFYCTVEVLKDSCDYALDKGVIIATENLLINEELDMFFEEINKPNLKLYFDTQNYYINMGYNTPDLIERMYKYICQVHVKDGKDRELSGAPLGKGDTKFYESMEKFNNLGYEGWFISENYYDREPLRSRGKNAIELVKKDMETIKSILRKCNK